ncbi:MAG: sigma-70 family RNA polymerase sigma factor [Phycisphaerae bacterium]|nr:sigma-70 family RNA polymerase sigma factor [Phycisphaerae bacterium]
MDTVTSLTLLEGLTDPQNKAAWQRFMGRYQPMVLAFAHRLGLDDNDSQDASQDTMMAFVEGYRRGAYDRKKGRLRSWLFGIAYRKVQDVQRAKGRELVMSDKSDATAFLDSVKAPETAQEVWEQEWQRAVLRECMSEVEKQFDSTTLQAFGLYVLDECPAEQVAERLGLSRNAVYIAKNRVTSRLRELRQRLEEIW